MLPESSYHKRMDEREVNICSQCHTYMWKVEGMTTCGTCRCNAEIQNKLLKITRADEISGVEMVELRTIRHAIQENDKLKFDDAAEEIERRQMKLDQLRDSAAKAVGSKETTESDSFERWQEMKQMKHLECCVRLLEMHQRGTMRIKVTRG